MGSCCSVKPVPYKFQAGIQDQAVAFRKGAQQPEDLVLLVKVQNMGTDAIRLAPKDPAAKNGLRVHAELLDTALPLELVSADLEPGTRAGLCLKGFSNANQFSLIDTHDYVVKSLAKSARKLFKHDPDSYETSLHLNANEAFVFLTLKVKWDQVPADVPSARYDVPVRLTFRYVDKDGNILKHPGALEHVATVNLSNGRRYPTFLPVIGGPVTGRIE
jgi:hypothetical protein